MNLAAVFYRVGETFSGQWIARRNQLAAILKYSLYRYMLFINEKILNSFKLRSGELNRIMNCISIFRR